MKSKVLDIKNEGNSKCYLCKIPIKEYILSLPEGFKDYEVQREIVKNAYLDSLIDTVLDKKHIPPIVLVVENESFSLDSESNELTIHDFKILDGLQRTYRLRIIWKTVELFIDKLNIEKGILNFNRIQLSRNFSSELTKIDSNTKILESIIKHYKKNELNNGEELVKCFDSIQWFEIWSDLTPEEEVKKMLVLNAGHKPVKTKHQLELLFRNLIPIIKKVDLDSFELIREKEMTSIAYSKNRTYGAFHFSHLITSILSYDEGKPLTSNVNLVHKTQNSDFEFERFEKYFNYTYLHLFISKLLLLDKNVSSEFTDGRKWIGREISLVGMFAALGKFAKNEKLNPLEALNTLEEKIVLNPSCLNLDEFEKIRNSLDLSKINIGTVNKNAVYNGVYDILSGLEPRIDWSNYFKGQIK